MEMQMSRVTQFLIASVFLLSTTAAFAEDMKVGFVDMQRALTETDDGKKAKDKLKKNFDQKQKELDEQQNALRKDKEDLDKKRTLIPADKVHEKEAELGARLEKLQQTYMRLQQELAAQEQKETGKIFERMNKIIQEIAASENFSLIVDKTALVFAKPHLDLTNELIRRYNGGGGGGTSKAGPPTAGAKQPPAKK
jgi:outer membrane protein